MTLNLGESVRTALSEIWGHKLRTLLTLFGILLGTFAIVVMSSFLGGIVSIVWKGFDGLGFDGVVFVEDRGARDLREASINTRSRGLQPEDADVIMARRHLVIAVAPVSIDQQIVRRGATERKARIYGITPSFMVVRNRKLSSGRVFGELEEREYARECVLGWRLKTRLFGSEDPLGKFIAVGGRPFRVVGIGQKLGNIFVNDDDDIEEMEGLYIPLSTMRKFYQGDDSPLAFMAVKANNPDKVGDLKAEVVSALTLAHHGAKDFHVENIAEMMLRERKGVQEQLMNWKIVLGSIAGISLLVGGIGLLSVMLISIGERLYEIGLRKAIGASDKEIFLQFLSESMILSLIGGLLGVGIGIVGIVGLNLVVPFPMPINPGSLLLSLGIALGLGAAYGVYPAIKASRYQPVDALRSSA
jgi:putative ABC transport system permease protein